QLGHAADGQGGEAGVVGANVQAGLRRGVGAEGGDGGDGAEVGRRVAARAADLDEHVAGGVDAVQGRGPCPGGGVGVRHGDDAAGRVQVGVGLDAWGVGVGVDDGAGVGVQAQVLPRVADHAQLVSHRVDVQAERGADELDGEGAGADLGGCPGGRV